MSGHASVELEPYFVKALKLLQSKNKESTIQLKAMLDDVIAQRKGLKPISKETKASSEKSETDSPSKGEQASEKTSRARSSSEKEHKKAEPAAGEKRPAKFEDNLVEYTKRHKTCDSDHGSSKSDSSDGVKAKKKKHKSDHQSHKKKSKKNKHHRSHSRDKNDDDSATTKERRASVDSATPSVEEKVIPSGDESDGEGSAYNSSSEGASSGLAASGSGSSVADIDAFADSLGVACVVCKSFDVQTGNTLVECQDCHSLYHQDCHRPKISDAEVNDPRCVWYCSRCKKNMKKMANEPRPLVSVSPKPVTEKSTSSSSTSSTTSTTTSVAPPRLTFTFTSSPCGNMTMTPSADGLKSPGKSRSSSSVDTPSSSTSSSSSSSSSTTTTTTVVVSSGHESNGGKSRSTPNASTAALSGLASLAANLKSGNGGNGSSSSSSSSSATSSAATTAATPTNIWGAFGANSSSSLLPASSNAASVTTTATSQQGTAPASGLAGLAANHAANRRLQDMKKRAAKTTKTENRSK